MGLRDSGLSEDSVKLWDCFWKRREKASMESWSKRRVKEILSMYVRPGMNVLDAGCGTGFFSAYFVSIGCRVYSMDYSDEALFITKRLTSHKSKMYIKGDILDKKMFSDVSVKFDIIFTDGLLEHYDKNEQDRIIVNLKGLKRDGGYMINFVPNRFSLWSLVRPLVMDIKEEPFIMKNLLGLHAKHGLDIIKNGGVNVLPFMASPEKLLGRYFGMLFYCVAR